MVYYILTIGLSITLEIFCRGDPAGRPLMG